MVYRTREGPCTYSLLVRSTWPGRAQLRSRGRRAPYQAGEAEHPRSVGRVTEQTVAGCVSIRPVLFHVRPGRVLRPSSRTLISRYPKHVGPLRGRALRRAAPPRRKKISGSVPGSLVAPRPRAPAAAGGCASRRPPGYPPKGRRVRIRVWLRLRLRRFVPERTPIRMGGAPFGFPWWVQRRIHSID